MQDQHEAFVLAWVFDIHIKALILSQCLWCLFLAKKIITVNVKTKWIIVVETLR